MQKAASVRYIEMLLFLLHHPRLHYHQHRVNLPFDVNPSNKQCYVLWNILHLCSTNAIFLALPSYSKLCGWLHCKSKWIPEEGNLITKEHTIKRQADRRTDSFIVIIIMWNRQRHHPPHVLWNQNDSKFNWLQFVGADRVSSVYKIILRCCSVPIATPSPSL
jgi:hypothetical protein